MSARRSGEGTLEDKAPAGPGRGSRHEDAFRSSVWGLSDYEPGRSGESVAQQYGLRVQDVVKLASNENPYGPSPAVRRAMTAEFDALHLYAWEEFTRLKECLAKANAVKPSNIVVSAGSGPLMEILPILYVQTGDEVITSAQTYARYASCSTALGAVVREVALRDYCFDLGAMAAAVNTRTKMVWVCNPNNPTGTILREAEVARFLEAVPERVAIIFDEAYAEYVDADCCANALAFLRRGHENVIVLRTFSKAYGLAGLRLGYAIANENVCRMLNRIAEPFSISRFAAAAGPAALADEAWLARTTEAVRLGRQWMTDALTAIGCEVVPSQANFVLVDVHCDALELAERLMKRGIVVRPGQAWGYAGHMRVTIGTQEQNELFLDALTRELPSSDRK